MTHELHIDVGRLVGSGTWSPEDGAVLRRLVLADRLTRLLALRRAVRDEGAVQDGDPFDLAWRALRALPASGLHEVVATPAAGAWLATAQALIGRDAHRRLPGGHAEAHLGRLAELVVPWLDQLPPGTELRFRLRSEPIVLLDRPGATAMRFPLELAGAEVRVTASGASPSFRTGDDIRLAGVGQMVQAPVVDGIVIDAFGPYRSLGAGDRHFAEHDDDATAEVARLLPGALKLIDRADPVHADVRDIVTRVFPMTTVGPAVLNHTAKAMFGALATTLPASPALLAEVLVHETQHSKLHAAEVAVALVETGDTARHYSPWRDDPRPAGAVLHGALSFVAVAELWAASGSEARAEAARRAQQVLAACDSLDDAPLTGTGREIATSTRSRATAVLDAFGSIGEATVRDVSAALAAHRREWDVRRSPQPVADEGLALAPPAAGGGLLAALGAPGGLPRNPLERREIRADPTAGVLGRLSVDDPDVFAATLRATEESPPTDPVARAVLAGHVAYIERDFGAALASYETAVEADSQNVDRWADLAFCLRHLGRTDEASAVLHHLDRLAQPPYGLPIPVSERIAAVCT